VKTSHFSSVPFLDVNSAKLKPLEDWNILEMFSHPTFCSTTQVLLQKLSTSSR